MNGADKALIVVLPASQYSPNLVEPSEQALDAGNTGYLMLLRGY